MNLIKLDNLSDRELLLLNVQETQELKAQVIKINSLVAKNQQNIALIQVAREERGRKLDEIDEMAKKLLKVNEDMPSVQVGDRLWPINLRQILIILVVGAILGAGGSGIASLIELIK